jgi:FkbM family methyltransferase
MMGRLGIRFDRRTLGAVFAGCAILVLLFFAYRAVRTPCRVGDEVVVDQNDVVDRGTGRLAAALKAAAPIDPRGSNYSGGAPPWHGTTLLVRRYVVRTTTVPPFILATLDPVAESNHGPSVEPHVDGVWERKVTDAFRGILLKACSPDRPPRENPLVVDVGANIGYFANYAAAMGCRVVAVEPNPGLLDVMLASALLNGHVNRLTAVPKAAGARPGAIYMSTHKTCPACASVVDRRAANLLAESEPLAAIVAAHAGAAQRIPLLKIDVDGLEMRVLHGAMPLLREGRVTNILCEVTPAWWGRGAEAMSLEEGRAVMREVLALGYAARDLETGAALAADAAWLTAETDAFLWIVRTR